MARRNSPNDIAELGDLTRLGDLVFDKRQTQRASAKKHRRNRHYEKQFIRNTLAHLPRGDGLAEGDDLLPAAEPPGP
ncbi:hypothetical protein D621_17055 [beta proteobacterium AAP51]|nr:hypothetical protein D621_17055 [beta proteobacterium AAP51]